MKYLKVASGEAKNNRKNERINSKKFKYEYKVRVKINSNKIIRDNT